MKVDPHRRRWCWTIPQPTPAIGAIVIATGRIWVDRESRTSTALTVESWPFHQTIATTMAGESRPSSRQAYQMWNMRLPSSPLSPTRSSMLPLTSSVSSTNTQNHLTSMSTSSSSSSSSPSIDRTTTTTTTTTTTAKKALWSRRRGRRDDATPPITDAQRQLIVIQHEFKRLARSTITGSMGPYATSPGSPRLLPLGSPGPVTPLQLESDDGEPGGAGHDDGAERGEAAGDYLSMGAGLVRERSKHPIHHAWELGLDHLGRERRMIEDDVGQRNSMMTTTPIHWESKGRQHLERVMSS